MDFISVYDDYFSDLGRYSKGSFLYEGEIYVRVNATDREVTIELQKIYDTHPILEVKFKAMESCIAHLSRIILSRYC
jgi:hypothetical protein